MYTGYDQYFQVEIMLKTYFKTLDALYQQIINNAVDILVFEFEKSLRYQLNNLKLP